MKLKQIKQIVCGAVAAASMSLGASQSHAMLFNFGPISDEGGTATAMMDISIVGNVVTATIDNTSPILLDDLSGDNAPGITGFGFDLSPDALNLDSWSLVAMDAGLNQTTITSDWNVLVNTNFNGITVDYTPNTNTGANGAIYNPAAI